MNSNEVSQKNLKLTKFSSKIFAKAHYVKSPFLVQKEDFDKMYFEFF